MTHSWTTKICPINKAILHLMFKDKAHYDSSSRPDMKRTPSYLKVWKTHVYEVQPCWGQACHQTWGTFLDPLCGAHVWSQLFYLPLVMICVDYAVKWPKKFTFPNIISSLTKILSMEICTCILILQFPNYIFQHSAEICQIIGIKMPNKWNNLVM